MGGPQWQQTEVAGLSEVFRVTVYGLFSFRP